MYQFYTVQKHMPPQLHIDLTAKVILEMNMGTCFMAKEHQSCMFPYGLLQGESKLNEQTGSTPQLRRLCRYGGAVVVVSQIEEAI